MENCSLPRFVADEHALEIVEAYSYLEPFVVPVLEYCGVWFAIKQTLVRYHVLAVKTRTNFRERVWGFWSHLVRTRDALGHPENLAHFGVVNLFVASWRKLSDVELATRKTRKSTHDSLHLATHRLFCLCLQTGASTGPHRAPVAMTADSTTASNVGTQAGASPPHPPSYRRCTLHLNVDRCDGKNKADVVCRVSRV